MELPIFLCLFLLATSCQCSSEHDPVVQLPLGKIRGKHEDGYYSFHNIPYAEPPIGSRRFVAPIRYNKPWSGERDARQAIISCIKFGKYSPPSGSEDCLYLHVVTPAITCDRMYPVHVFIHSGAYMSGSPDECDTSILVKRGVVVLTMGYRLGPLGFLSSGDTVISGNYGLKDQRLAIEWAKANIHAFCGDPNKILLDGLSAGGASAHLHLLQKSTENYVTAVASHNGVATCPWAIETKPEINFKKFANLLNCPSDSEELKSCLQSKSIKELIEATTGLAHYKGNPLLVFAPVVEPAGSADPFLIEHPEEMIRHGKAANLPWLVAFAEREGACNAAEFLNPNKDTSPEFSDLNERWPELAPMFLFFNNTKSEEERIEYSAFLRDKYLGDKEFSEANYRLIEDMFSDEMFKNGIEKSIELHRKHCPGKVYVYYYRYPHTYGLGNLFSSRNDISFGADHLSDTIFTMPYQLIKPSSLSERDRKVADKLLDMYLTWTNTGLLSFGGQELPLNTPTHEGRLTINENCFSMDYCTDVDDAECQCLGYD